MPTSMQPGDVLRCQQTRAFAAMRSWIEAESSGAAKLIGNWINVLQVLTFVFNHPRVLEVAAPL